MILEIIKKIKKKYHLFKKSGKSKDKYGITLKKRRYVSQQIGTLCKYKITVKMWMQKLSLSFISRLGRAKWRKK